MLTSRRPSGIGGVRWTEHSRISPDFKQNKFLRQLANCGWDDFPGRYPDQFFSLDILESLAGRGFRQDLSRKI
jgi:hypothetical protein